MYPRFAGICRSYGATLFVSGKFYKHGVPTALNGFFNGLPSGGH